MPSEREREGRRDRERRVTKKTADRNEYRFRTAANKSSIGSLKENIGKKRGLESDR